MDIMPDTHTRDTAKRNIIHRQVDTLPDVWCVLFRAVVGEQTQCQAGKLYRHPDPANNARHIGGVGAGIPHNLPFWRLV